MTDPRMYVQYVRTYGAQRPDLWWWRMAAGLFESERALVAGLVAGPSGPGSPAPHGGKGL